MEPGLLGTISNTFLGAQAFGDPRETFRNNTPQGLLNQFSEEEQRRIGEQLQGQFRQVFRDRDDIRDRFEESVTSQAQRRRVASTLPRLVEGGELTPQQAQIVQSLPTEEAVGVISDLLSPANVGAGADRTVGSNVITSTPTTDQQNLAAANVDPTSEDGRATLTDAPGRGVLEAITVADKDNPNSRRTVLRTSQGIFEQTVNNNGEPVLTPVDTTQIREISTREQGSREELGTIDKRNLDSAQIATVGLTRTANDALKLLDESESVNTFTAGASGIVNSLKQEGRALANALDRDFEESQLNPARFDDTFEELGIDNTRLKGLFTSLAFQAAAANGQTGRSVSDTDVKRFLRQTGASSGDPDTIRAVLSDLINRTQRGFRDRFQIKTGREFEGDLPELFSSKSQQEQGLPEGVPEGSTRAGTFEGKPVFTTPEGRRLVVE